MPNERSLISLAVTLLALVSAPAARTQSQDPAARAEVLVRQLRSNDPVERGVARIELKGAPRPEALPVLLQALSATRDPSLRDLLVDVLSVYRDARKLPALVTLAVEFRPISVERQLVEQGAAAAHALVNSVTCDVQARDFAYPSWVADVVNDIGPAGLPALLAGLKSSDECRQKSAAEGLMRDYMRPAYMIDSVEWAYARLLVQAATTGDAATRGVAIRWIDRLPNPERPDNATLVDAMIGAYRTAPAASKRTIAALLAEVPTARVLRFMNAAVEAPDSQIHAIARRYVADSRAARAPTRPVRQARPRTSRQKIERAESLAYDTDDDSTATRALVRLLADADPAVRVAAATALGTLQGARGGMMQHLDNRARDVDGSVPPLLKLLTDASAPVRAAAAGALGEILTGEYSVYSDSASGRGRLAVRSLSRLTALLRDRDTSVIVAALAAMGRVGSPTTVPALVPFADHPRVTIRAAAVGALAGIAGAETPNATCPIVARLKDSDERIRYRAAGGVAKALESGVRCPDDEEILLAAFDEQALRSSLYEALGRLRIVRAIPKLVSAMSDVPRGEPYGACWPCIAIGEIGGTAAVESLLSLLTDSNVVVVVGAISELAKLDAPRAAPKIQLMLDDPRAHVRATAIGALQAMNRCDAMPVIRRWLSDDAMPVRHSAANAAGHCRDRESVPGLIPLLASDEEIRPIVRAMGAIGDARAVEPLLQAFGLVRCFYRGPVAAALGQLGDPRAVDPLIAALTRTKSAPEDDCAEVEAIDALGEIGDPRARPALEAIVRRAGPDFSSRAAERAAAALRKIRGT